MVKGWRRVFCTSIPKEDTDDTKHYCHQHNPPSPCTPSPSTKSPRSFPFFYSSPTPNSSLSCKTPPPTTTSNSNSNSNSNSTSKSNTTPRLSSPSSFSLQLILKNSLRFGASNPTSCCGICSHPVKSGHATAIFTSECSHSFHFPCISSFYAANHNTACPVCGSHWNQSPFLISPLEISTSHTRRRRPLLYDDDEPLMSPLSGIRFNPIPESDEEESQHDSSIHDFPTPSPPPHFFPNTDNNNHHHHVVDVTISPEAAVVAVGRTYETYAVVLKLRAPPPCRRPSVDLVTILDVGGDMIMISTLKKAMKAVIISSLSSNDRLSIVAFSAEAGTKRLLPLRRMTPSGRRSARRIVDALSAADSHKKGTSTTTVNDALKKAARVLQDRKEKNHSATIILLDQEDHLKHNHNRTRQHEMMVSSTRLSHMDIPLHTFSLVGDDIDETSFVNSLNGFLSVVILDLQIQIGLASGSAPAEIAAVYSCSGRPTLLNAGLAKVGDLYSEEERQILVELKVPAASIGSNHIISVKFFHKDASTKQMIYGGHQSLMVPRPHTIRSSDPSIQRVRSLFVMTRAVAESRRLIKERDDVGGAERLLVSARAVLGQRNLRFVEVDEWRRRVEGELVEIRRRQQEEKLKREKDKKAGGGRRCCLVDDKGEALTPTSAWKAAERLAKVAIMRKSLNRVSDLHGFEDARF